MNSREFIESGVLETYVMGLATAEEAKLVAEMTARYPEVKAELEAIEVTIEKFDRLNAVAPPAHLKAEILAQVSGSQFPVSGSTNFVSSSTSTPLSIDSVGNKERGANIRSLNGSEHGPPKQSNFFKYAAGVALILLLGSVYYNYTLSSKLNEAKNKVDNLDYAYYLRSSRAHLDSLTIQELNDQIALLSTPGMKSIELKGMDVAPDAKAMAYANTKTGEVYLEIMNLPAVPEGMQYQFWGIVEDKPVDAGMIPLEGDLSGIHPMTTVPNANAYAISLEPKGGSEQPTGKIYVMGNP